MASTETNHQQGWAPAEREVRVHLAAAYRLVAHNGWDDLIFTHLSARVPGPEHHFLINPYDRMFDEITASSLVKIDVLWPPGRGQPVSGEPGRIYYTLGHSHGAGRRPGCDAPSYPLWSGCVRDGMGRCPTLKRPWWRRTMWRTTTMRGSRPTWKNANVSSPTWVRRMR